MLENFSTISPFAALLDKIAIRDYHRKKVEQPIPKKLGLLRPCLHLETQETKEVYETQKVVFTLKIRAGGAATAGTYKKCLRKFQEGSVQDWIDTLEALEEVWTQNSIVSASDRLQPSGPF